MTSGNVTDALSQARSGLPMTADRIQQQLQRILTNPAFRATKAQKAFLKFVVSKTLSGKAMEIKGYTVATRVFGRRENFDRTPPWIKRCRLLKKECSLNRPTSGSD